MSNHTKYIVSKNYLQIVPSPIQVNSNDWFAWLLDHKKFSYQDELGSFQARSETRRQKTFWYAYRRRGGKLFKHYLGKSEELTYERLEQTSAILAGINPIEQQGNHPNKEYSPIYGSRINISLLPMTKINLPALPLHLVTRSRLNQQINLPLTLIYAPSGFGKSTLLNDWSRTCGHPVAWLSLDERDNQPISFWYSITLAMQMIQPNFGADLLAYLQKASPIQSHDVVSLITNEIVKMQVNYPCCSLVLDDFHLINHTEIYDQLQLWFERFPTNLQLIISGHIRPPLSLGHLRAKGFVSELDANDLRFTLDEGIEYMKMYPQATLLVYTDLEKLVKHSEGWATGLTLTGLALGKQENPHLFIETFSGAHIYLREYFLETVLERSTTEVQTFLLKTAILKHLTGSLCDAVTGQTGGEEMLERLWKDGLFIVRLEEQGWYRYHDLFAEMLLSQLQTRFPEDVPVLHQRAAQWYNEQYAPANAVYHLLATNAWEEAASLMESMALRELEQYGEDSRLLRWLQELPESVVQKHKTLLFLYLRLADIALPTQKTERFIARIQSNLSNKPAILQDEDEREVLREIRYIQKTWRQGSNYTPPAQADKETAARWEMLNGLHLLKLDYGPNFNLMQSQLMELFQKAKTQHNLFMILMIGGALARRILPTGRLRMSEKICRQVIQQAILLRGKLPEPASIALAVLSHICIERNELAQAQRYLTQVKEVDPNPVSTNMTTQISILMVKIQISQGKIQDALANIRAIRELHTRRPSAVWSDQELMAYEAMACIRSGNFATAEQIIDEAASIGDNYLVQLVFAEILLWKNQAHQAEQITTQLITNFPLGKIFEPLMYARVLLVRALLEQSKIYQALQIITDALRSAAPEHLIRPFLESCDHLNTLLVLTLRTENLTPDTQNFIHEILYLSGYSEEDSKNDVDGLATSASISEREQDVLDLLNNGYSNRDLAKQLCISESTVKTHLRNIYGKLGVNNRMQAIKKANELKLVR